jgi:hypothetical protein
MLRMPKNTFVGRPAEPEQPDTWQAAAARKLATLPGWTGGSAATAMAIKRLNRHYRQTEIVAVVEWAAEKQVQTVKTPQAFADNFRKLQRAAAEDCGSEVAVPAVKRVVAALTAKAVDWPGISGRTLSAAVALSLERYAAWRACLTALQARLEAKENHLRKPAGGVYCLDPLKAFVDQVVAFCGPPEAFVEWWLGRRVYDHLKTWREFQGSVVDYAWSPSIKLFDQWGYELSNRFSGRPDGWDRLKKELEGTEGSGEDL